MSSVQQLAAMAIDHWKKFLPNKTAELRQAGTLELRANSEAEQAMRQIQILMKAGLRDDEAREIVLPEYILLPPER